MSINYYKYMLWSDSFTEFPPQKHKFNEIWNFKFGTVWLPLKLSVAANVFDAMSIRRIFVCVHYSRSGKMFRIICIKSRIKRSPFIVMSKLSTKNSRKLLIFKIKCLNNLITQSSGKGRRMKAMEGENKRAWANRTKATVAWMSSPSTESAVLPPSHHSIAQHNHNHTTAVSKKSERKIHAHCLQVHTQCKVLNLTFIYFIPKSKT